MRLRFCTIFFIIGCIFASTVAINANETLRIYYLRHAEGGHNVVKRWENKPKEQWPPYVGNHNMFTPKGEKQVKAITDKLHGIKFDFIAVSPAWRTRNTILPYLKKCNMKAEIWPELIETVVAPVEWTTDKESVPPAPSAELFNGKSIVLPEDEREFFVFRKDGKRYANIHNHSDEQKKANSLALSQKVMEMLQTRFSKSGKNILLVGHCLAGSTLIRVLTTAKAEKHYLGNTKMWIAEEQPDGSFRLVIVNDKPSQ